MIYDFTVTTGDVSVSGCSSELLHTNTFKETNRQAGGSSNSFYYDRSVSTGQREIKLSLNGQTLLQEIPTKTTITNETIFTVATGDFFTKTDQETSTDQGLLNFDPSVPTNANSIFLYDIESGIASASGGFGTNLATGIRNVFGGSTKFEDYDYFLNGQKLYSGVGVGALNGAADVPQFVVTAPAVGIVTTLNKSNFKSIAFKKRARTFSYTGISPDYFSTTGFVEGRSVFYINGISQPKSIYLELYTGVNIIKQGFSALISGSELENVTESTLLL